MWKSTTGFRPGATWGAYTRRRGISGARDMRAVEYHRSLSEWSVARRTEGQRETRIDGRELVDLITARAKVRIARGETLGNLARVFCCAAPPGVWRVAGPIALELWRARAHLRAFLLTRDVEPRLSPLLVRFVELGNGIPSCHITDTVARVCAMLCRA